MEPPKKLIERILDFCIMLAVSTYLLRLAARWLVEAAPYLTFFAAIALIATIGYRAWRYMRDVGKW